MRYVHGIGDNQAHVPVDAGAGVPARRRLAGVVRAIGEHVPGMPVSVQMSGKLVAKADIAVRPLTKVKAVDPYVAVGHDAVKVDEDTPAFVVRGQSKIFAIPAHAGW